MRLLHAPAEHVTNQSNATEVVLLQWLSMVSMWKQLSTHTGVFQLFICKQLLMRKDY